MNTKINYRLILITLTGITLLLALFAGCSKDNDDNDTITTGTFADPRDGTVYKTLTIGSQTWLAENLKYLPLVNTPGTGSRTDPCYYVFGYQGTNVAEAKGNSNYTTYGVLYNWPAAMSACPAGWHLPSDAEWSQLMDRLGGQDIAGGKLKESGTTHWNDPNTGATNETGFSFIPGGFRNDDAELLYTGTNGYWWSSTEFGSSTAWGRGMYYKSNKVSRDASYKSYGFSVVCIKDK